MFPKLSNLLLFSFIGFVDVHKIEFGFIFSVELEKYKNDIQFVGNEYANI